MEKERQMQCVPVELLDRLRDLAARMWKEKSPGAVHLSALMEEFGVEVRTLGNVLKQYEDEYSSQLAARQGKFDQREARLKKEIEDLKAALARSEAEKSEALKLQTELRVHLASGERSMAELKTRTAEEEGELNSRYVAKMEELYEKVGKKERDMLARWEEKNRALEAKSMELETGLGARAKQLKVRERELEEEFNARKAELIRTFDRIREGLETREKALAEREAGRTAKGGAV
ncbi:MAG: hypothetical protein M0011_00995 [Elusimicrobia bacterium]|nr:hypothetical protein [Elusimicrobiota bacterium]